MSRLRASGATAGQARDRGDGASAGQAAVAFDHVSKSFGAHKVLDEVTFQISKAKAFCLLGRSGTGKSVTLRHIIGLLRPDAGRVVIDGRDITDASARELSDVRKHMGFLFQNAALFDSMTVGDNVAFPLRRHTRLSDGDIRRRAKEKLADVGLEKDFDKMPADLSGGMKKRAGLARAMALDPSILLVDEPSAGLDPMTTAEIDELLAERKRGGTTLVVVTHNIPSARALADELALLHDGRIVARGTVAEIDRSSDPFVQAFMRAEAAG
jgi:phospholipid/cholesterol/gamma-HCH transport system ATP-binding protein